MKSRLLYVKFNALKFSFLALTLVFYHLGIDYYRIYGYWFVLPFGVSLLLLMLVQCFDRVSPDED